jgi:hypothetical protein
MASPLTLVVGAALLAGTAACGDDSLGIEPLSGRFALTRFNGDSLPIDQGPAPNRDGTFGPGHDFLTCGFLSLEVVTQTFELTYRIHVLDPASAEEFASAQQGICSEPGISNQQLVGTYVQNGSLLQLHVPAPADPSRARDLIGRITDDRIVVTIFEDRFTFVP